MSSSESGNGHDCWLVAWFDSELKRLKHDLFRIPLDVVLGGDPVRWRDEVIVPHLIQTFGNCFADVTDRVTATTITCPECLQHNLSVDRGIWQR
jgi:hypothetical protein